MQVLITDTPHPLLVEKLQAAGIHCDVRNGISYADALALMPEYDGLIVRSKIEIDRHFIDHIGPRCRVIGREGAGMETIDVDYAEAHGIRCLNSPEGNRDAVGEHTLGLLLCLFNKIALANAEVKQGLWRREANRGLEIKGKTVGIIGYGNMGQAFAQRLKGFGCRILYYDKYHPHPCRDGACPRLNPDEETGTRPVSTSLETLQQEADIVSLHVPLTPETHYMVNRQFLSAFRKPIYLLNTSRGKVVETAALVEAMASGKVLGCALDVLEYEQMTQDGAQLSTLNSPLSTLLADKRALLTPHVAGWTVESKEKLALFLAEKIINCLSAQAPKRQSEI